MTWDQRLAQSTSAVIASERALRYRFVSPLIRASDVWVDLGCGSGRAAAEGLGEGFKGRLVLVDRDEDSLHEARRQLSAQQTIDVRADLSSLADLDRLKSEVLESSSGENACVTCFGQIEQLPDFLPLLDLLIAFERTGSTVALSVPNDSFWSVEDADHRTNWSGEALEEFRRNLPTDHLLVRQFPLAGSCLKAVTGDRPEASYEASVRISDERVPSHQLVIFGPALDKFEEGASLAQVDLDSQRSWERQREAYLAAYRARENGRGAQTDLAHAVFDLNTEHRRAESIFRRMRAYPELPELDSRLSELVDYFGWETGQKAPYCRPWFFHDDPAREQLRDKLGLSEAEFWIMHQYALFNRMDPERPDLFWIFDALVEHLERLGGPQKMSVLDFGCGLGQIGLAFNLAGYRTVLTDSDGDVLEFARFVHESHGLRPEIWRSPTERSYYDTSEDGQPFGLIVEWSVFEHIHDGVEALERICGGLVNGGLLVTTTLAKDWTPELEEHYRRDAGEEVAGDLFSGEAEAWVRERFDVVSPPRSIAKILIKRK